MKKKSLTPWIVLLVAPYAALVLTAIVQMGVRFLITGQGDGYNMLTVVVNIVSFLLGVIAVIAIVLTPLWIVMIVKTSNDNKKLPEVRR
jgi:uncharacterized membrane protein